MAWCKRRYFNQDLCLFELNIERNSGQDMITSPYHFCKMIDDAKEEEKSKKLLIIKLQNQQQRCNFVKRNTKKGSKKRRRVCNLRRNDGFFRGFNYFVKSKCET